MEKRKRAKGKGDAKVTRYTYDDVKEARTPETGHTSLLPTEEQVVEVLMDNGWAGGISVGAAPDHERPVVIDMDPAVDPVLFWSGKRSRRDVPLLPLQRNEIVSGSRIAQIIQRVRTAAAERQPQQSWLFADFEKSLRESDRSHRVEFYEHDEGWKNKLICGDSLQVIESLVHHEGLRGKVQVVYTDPPYGIDYNSNFQQRVDSAANNPDDHADDVITLKAYRDTWALGVHSYLSYLEERLYGCRELLADSGSIFVQIGDDNCHLVRQVLDEVFGAANFVSQITIRKTAGKASSALDAVYDLILWYAKDKAAAEARFNPLYEARSKEILDAQYRWLELPDGTNVKLTTEQLEGTAPIPIGRRFGDHNLTSQGEARESFPIEFQGRTYSSPGAGRHWTTTREGIERLKAENRLIAVGTWLKYKRYAEDFPYTALRNQWQDTVFSTFSREKVYAVQTPSKVVERCLLMASRPGDLVFDPTCGSGTTAYASEKWGRRWITCDTSRVALNVARQRLLSAVFPHYRTTNGLVSGDFVYRTADRVTAKSIAYNLEPEKVAFVDRPETESDAIRVAGPFEVMSVGRYSVEDWRGYLISESDNGYADSARLENYIDVICKLYRKDASTQGATGFVHAVVDFGSERMGISVGPLSGRVTGKQINDALQDALASGIRELHVLGWAFEANVGEVKARLETGGTGVNIQLIMIRPDTLAEGLKVTNPEMLFSPLALPDVRVSVTKTRAGLEATAILDGVAVFDRKQRRTEYKRSDSGYVSAWYLDEDYDGDCFVDSQMFFAFKRAPDLKSEIDPSEFKLATSSHPFPVRKYKRIAVKVVDVYGNESTLVRELA